MPRRASLKYQRILLKLSGEALAGDGGHGFDFQTIAGYARALKEIVGSGAQVGLVIGGGNSGMEEGLFLTQFAEHVTIFARKDGLTGSKLLQDKVNEHPQIDVVANVEVAAFNADANGLVESITLRDLDSGAEHVHPCRAVFLFIGLDPTTAWLNGLVELDERGFVQTDRNLETSVKGVFAAGDVRAGSTKQLASAVGEGAAVSIQIRYHLNALEDGRA